MLHSYLQRGALRHEHNGPVTTTPLTFGTAGLRGIMGMGTNCLNRFTIAWATAGIAEWLGEIGKKGQPERAGLFLVLTAASDS